MKASVRATVTLIHADPQLPSSYYSDAQSYLLSGYSYYGHSSSAASYVSNAMNSRYGNHWATFLGDDLKYMYWYSWDDSMGFAVNYGYEYHAEVFRK